MEAERAHGKERAGVAYGANMIFDHMSVTWGRDECFSINGDPKKPGDQPRNITIQNSFIGQGLQPHSCGGLIQTTAENGVTLYRNLYIDNKTRNPKVKGLNQFVNNVVYNWGNGGAYIMGDTEQTSEADIRNNYFIVGATLNYDGKTLGATAPFTRYNEHFRAHLSGNYYDENKDGVLNGRELTREDCTKRKQESGTEVVITPTFLDKPSDVHPTVEGLMTARDAYEWIVQHGGASLPCPHNKRIRPCPGRPSPKTKNRIRLRSAPMITNTVVHVGGSKLEVYSVVGIRVKEIPMKQPSGAYRRWTLPRVTTSSASATSNT